MSSEQPTLADILADARDKHGRHSAQWIQTYTGRQVWPLEVTVGCLDIVDIAHALSQICRFGGHSKSFYSVGEHCWLMATYAEARGNLDVALAALLHDAAEAYVIDLPAPIKEIMPIYRAIDHDIQRVVEESWMGHIQDIATVKSLVKALDQRILVTEASVLMRVDLIPWHRRLGEPLEVTIPCLEPRTAERLYLETFRRLTGLNPLREG